jgi:hypothetical protein
MDEAMPDSHPAQVSVHCSDGRHKSKLKGVCFYPHFMELFPCFLRIYSVMQPINNSAMA